MIKVSIIVAVYQAEKYIHRCLDSLQNQTLEDIEFILVDDGSKDQSGKICDEYGKTDSRFKIFHKKNGGVSSARQYGLDHAQGEYVIHVDPDDWVDVNMAKELYETAIRNKSDMVICDYYQELNEKTTYIQQKPSSNTNKIYFYDLINKLHGSCCNKLVRKSCFSKFNIKFPQNMIMWEDKYVNLKLAQCPISISYLPKAYYHYDESNNTNGAVQSWSKKKTLSQAYLIDWLDSIDDPIVKNEVIKLKMSAKKSAFFARDFGSKEFHSLYPEIRHLYKFKFSQIGRLSFMQFVAERISLRLARLLYICKTHLIATVRKK